MDTVLPRKRFGKRSQLIVAVVALVLGGAALAWKLMPQGLSVAARDVRTATVTRGLFHDDIVVRAAAAPLSSVILDAVESGRVEEVYARDGKLLSTNELIFRLSNPQRRLELLARESDLATQISNLSNLRVVFEAGRRDHLRRALELKYALAQAQREYQRNTSMARQGFIADAALEISADKVTQARQALQDEDASARIDMQTKENALRQMEHAIASMESGLSLVRANMGALVVRAPTAGRLTDFHLQVGETVKLDQHIGRIDDPQNFKLVAQVDEFYLSRVAVGQRAEVKSGAATFEAQVSRIFPQISGGRFKAELTFNKGQPPKMSPGQSIDVQIALGDPTQALHVVNGPFMNDGGGTWVFVLDANGQTASRRAIRTGRRNNAQVEILSGLAAGERILTSSYAGFLHANRLELTK